MQRYGGNFVDSRAQSGEAEEGVHQNNPHHQFSGKLMAQTFSLALEMRKFSEESHEELCKSQRNGAKIKIIIVELRKENGQQPE